jgi:RimJ/RimL family protein N-acetyltransferase
MLRGYGAFGCDDRATGAYVGEVGIYRPEGFPEPELGWFVVPEAEGQGYAAEAARAVLDWAHESFGWQRLVSYIDPANARSIALALRLGGVIDPSLPGVDGGDVVIRHDLRGALCGMTAPHLTSRSPARRRISPPCCRPGCRGSKPRGQSCAPRCWPTRRPGSPSWSPMRTGIWAAPTRQAGAFTEFAATVGLWLLRGHGLWTVTDREDRVLGFVLIGFEPGDQAPELGWLFLPEARGRGYAAEAAAAARAHALDTAGLPELVSYIDPANTRSQRLAQRLGARRAGRIADAQTGAWVEIWRHAPAPQSETRP